MVTSHPGLAERFGRRAHLLPWSAPETDAGGLDLQPGAIAYPLSTAARHGALDVREAIGDLPVRLLRQRRNHEGSGFWDGLRAAVDVASEHELRRCRVWVAPSWVSLHPGRLLAALERGSTVITTRRLGLPPHPRLVEVRAGDPIGLRAAIIQAACKRTVSARA